jgi:hypothetical protein
MNTYIDILKRLMADPIWVFSLVVIIFGLILEPSTSSVSLFGHPIPQLCYFKRFFELSCLGCGLTRSVVFAFHLDIETSLFMHLGGIPISVFSIMYAVKKIFISLMSIDKV